MKRYKVVTQADKFFSHKFSPDKLEAALNTYAAEGWTVTGIATATIPSFGKEKSEMVVVMEQDA